jgi:glycosyltransferase involved in cell wall biosynthesis
MVIHLIHHPVSAKKLVEPLVKSLDSHGVDVELWIENRKEFANFVEAVDCPKQFGEFDLSANPFRVLARIAGLLKRFAKLKPAAIHAHQTRAAFIPLLAAFAARVPVRIYHNRGTPYLGYRGGIRALLWLLEFLNCSFATHVITVSHSIREKMVRNRIVRDSKCTVLGKGSGCGIDLSEFSLEQFDKQHRLAARQSLEIPADAYVVLYVGRPFRRKGFDTLLGAWKRVTPKDDRQFLLIAGCSVEDVSSFADSSMKNVIALGYVQDTRSCYAACDVVVLPSWHEGFPYALLEGAAAARPLIGSNIPGIDSIIIDKENGLLVPPRDTIALADAIDKLKKNQDMRKLMGESGRRYVEKYFNRQVINRLLLDYYKSIGITDYSV